MKKTYIAVKALAPTDTKGKRISCSSTGHNKKTYPWDYRKDTSANFQSAATNYCRYLLAVAGYPIDEPASLVELQSTKTGLPVGYVWE